MEIDLTHALDPGETVGGRVTSYGGREAMWLEAGLARVRDRTFGDMEVSVDLAFTTRTSFGGLAFRGSDAENFELCYVTPLGSQEAVQYDPVFNGSNTWQVYCGADHLTAAHVPRDRWVTLTVRAVGNSATAFVDGVEVMRVHELKHRRAEGFIGIWCYRPCYFSLLTARLVNSGPFGTEPIRHWEISDKFSDDEDMSREIEPGCWQPVAAEEDGSVCLNRYRRKEPGCESVYARAFVESPDERRTELVLGFSDACIVRVNGRDVFRGSNFWGENNTGRLSWKPARLTVPLRRGPNEVLVKVMERDFFGWGLRLSIPDPDRALRVRQP
ncbi:MAG: DUF1080 domain-containing protein [Bacillota bacterium]|nr:DUF1080 domain-containing protein [Bacillota bacterium]